MADRRGLSGMDGLDGASAYEIAKAFGFGGSVHEWLVSLQGPPGRDGASVPVESVRAMVEDAVAKIQRPLDGKDGRDGIDGKAGTRGPRGERGMEGRAAELLPLVPWRADYYRDAVTKLVLRVRAGPSDGSGPFINLIPIRGEDSLIEHIDLIPEPT